MTRNEFVLNATIAVINRLVTREIVTSSDVDDAVCLAIKIAKKLADTVETDIEKSHNKKPWEK